jgi:hypothetical protein
MSDTLDQLEKKIVTLLRLYYCVKHSDLPGMDQFRKCTAFVQVEKMLEKEGIEV